MPALTYSLITCRIESVDGRKIWFKITMTDGPEPSAVVFLEARCLFVVARKEEEAIAAAAAAAPAASA